MGSFFKYLVSSVGGFIAILVLLSTIYSFTQEKIFFFDDQTWFLASLISVVIGYQMYQLKRMIFNVSRQHGIAIVKNVFKGIRYQSSTKKPPREFDDMEKSALESLAVDMENIEKTLDKSA